MGFPPFNPPSSIPKQVANPGAGNEISFTLGNNLIYNLISITYTLTTNAGGGNRVTSWFITDGTNVILRFGTTLVTAGAVTQFCSWADTTVLVNDGVNVIQVHSLPGNIVLFPGYKLESLTALIDGADTYTNVFLWFGQALTPITT